MSNLQEKLEALCEGLQLVNAQDFIRHGKIGDYRRLGQMIFDNGKANRERIRELEAALEQSKERLSAARVKYEQPMMRKALNLQKRVDELEALLARYRNEVPLGHQPHMIAHQVDRVLESKG